MEDADPGRVEDGIQAGHCCQVGEAEAAGSTSQRALRKLGVSEETQLTQGLKSRPGCSQPTAIFSTAQVSAGWSRAGVDASSGVLSQAVQMCILYHRGPS